MLKDICTIKGNNIKGNNNDDITTTTTTIFAGGSDDAKRAAAQVLVRKLHEMRRTEEERLVQEATASMDATSSTMNRSGSTGSGIGIGNTNQDILQSRIVALQNEIRQMREEGGVSLVIASRQAARSAEMETAAMAINLKRLENMKQES